MRPRRASRRLGPSRARPRLRRSSSHRRRPSSSPPLSSRSRPSHPWPLRPRRLRPSHSRLLRPCRLRLRHQSRALRLLCTSPYLRPRSRPRRQRLPRCRSRRSRRRVPLPPQHPTLRPQVPRRRTTMPAIAQSIDQQRENGQPLMARRVRQMVVRQRPARYLLVVVAEFRCEGEEGAAEIRMVEWVSWWASHRSSTLCRRRASSLR